MRSSNWRLKVVRHRGSVHPEDSGRIIIWTLNEFPDI
jgi:hypothetical protein